MIDKLNEYLMLNKKANLPGIGHFSVEYTSAKLDFINSKFYAPLPEIRFTGGVSGNDKYFLNFISGNSEADEIAGSRDFNDMLFDIKHKLSYQREAVLENMGTLKKTGEDNYSFEQKFSVEDFFPPVDAIRVSRNHAQQVVLAGSGNNTYTSSREQAVEEEIIKDRWWWVFAIILTVIGVAGLVYYYYGGFAN
jgi:hypothetical protein